MKTINHVKDVIENNKRAVVVFTHGQYFTYDPAGNGKTGKWHVNPSVVDTVDQVVIYLRRDDEKVNLIFLGNYAGIEKSDLPRRYFIHYSGPKEVSTTELNWRKFTGGSQNPVAYVVT